MANTGWTVITGASSGIGAELARLAARRGRPVALVARRGDRLQELAAEIGSRGGRVATRTLDLEQPMSAEDLMSWLDGEGMTLDTLVNNAGFGLRGGFATMPYAEQAAMVELNVTTLTRLCRLALPGLIARREGGIINISSMAAYQPIPFMAVYAATKAYVLSLSEALHEEARRHGVTVTAVCPGPTATEFTIRADLEKSKIFRLGSMSAAAVARIGLDGYEAGRAVVIPGATNRAVGWASSLFPRTLVRKAAGWMQG